jgi:hypothetical protein
VKYATRLPFTSFVSDFWTSSSSVLSFRFARVEVLADLDPLDLRLVLSFDALHERDVPVVADLELLRELGLERMIDVADGEVPSRELVEVAAQLRRDVARGREEEVGLDRLVEPLDERLRARADLGGLEVPEVPALVEFACRGS